MIVLVGFMGAGKSHVGRILATRLKLPFYDADHVIEERAGRRISEIFAKHGEPAFRALERTTIADLLHGRRAVLALGGGAASDPQTRALLTADAVTVYLQVSLEQARARIGTDPRRPMLPRKDLPEIYAQRAPIYASVARLTVETDHRTPDTVVKEIVRLLEQLPISPTG